MSTRQSLLLVANWDSGVGYAWWLMESFWVKLADQYCDDHLVLLAYPSITTLDSTIQSAPLKPIEQDFRGRNLSSLIGQCHFLRRNKVRLMYLSDWSTWSWRYLLFRLCGVRRIVIHDHTPGERTYPRGLKRRLKQVVNRIPWLTADGAIGATEYVRQRLKNVNCFPAGKCFAAPNGLPGPAENDDPGQVSVKQLFSIPWERSIMVMTGRANRYKNVGFVIECVAELVRAGQRELHFLFIGDGPDLEAFKVQAESLGVADHCTFPGRRSDVPIILPGCDFAIHPSRGEVGYSLSILEYMQAGLAVIVPNNPSVCAATEDGFTGFVYQRDDLSSAVGAIRRLLQDATLRERLGRSARNDVLERYQLDAAHRALLAAFGVIDGPGG